MTVMPAGEEAVMYQLKPSTDLGQMPGRIVGAARAFSRAASCRGSNTPREER
jgi:hypothetical protein